MRKYSCCGGDSNKKPVGYVFLNFLNSSLFLLVTRVTNGYNMGGSLLFS